MAGIGEASAILAVAQIGLQLAQTLVTVIGDYQDAAVSINRLRDEIHLTSICLQQLGDLAKEGRLIAGRGVLEATNLRERCSAVIWEIRMVIKKGDNPLHPEEITKDDIDVSYFTAWKWALWTRKHLEEPRLELDRIKNSITLTFVTHMAILANSEHERKKYTSQIPGIKRSCGWLEERYRKDEKPEEPVVPQELIDAGPGVLEEFVRWRNYRDQPILQLQAVKDLALDAGVSNEQIVAALGISNIGPAVTLPLLPEKSKTEYQAWSIDPFVGRIRMPVTEDWLRQATGQPQSSEEMWKIHSKLQPWYKKQVDELIHDLSGFGDQWLLFSLKVVHKSLFRRNENPPSLQVVLKGEVKDRPIPLLIQSRIGQPEIIIKPVTEDIEHVLISADHPEAVTYGGTVESESLTDEELIQQQLNLYKS